MNAQAVAVLEPAPRLPTIQAGAQPRALVPQDFEGAWRIANAVVKAGMAPKGVDTAEKAMVAIMHGLEVGMTPMMALQSIAPINGRPSVWGDGALGLCQGSGLLEWHKEYTRGTRGQDDFTAVCEVKRRGDPEVKIGEFSIADAKLAKLWGKAGPWTDYWPRMLKMRARAFALRDGFSDVLRGLHIAEEVQDIPTTRTRAPAPAEVGIEAEPARAMPKPPAPPKPEPKAAAALPAPEPQVESQHALDKLSNPEVREMVVNSPSAPPHVAKAPPKPPVPSHAPAPDQGRPAREERAPKPAGLPRPPAPPAGGNDTDLFDDFPGDKPMPDADVLTDLESRFSLASTEEMLQRMWAFAEEDITALPMAQRQEAEALYDRHLARIQRR